MTALGWCVVSGGAPPGEDWLSPWERDKLTGMKLAKRRGDFKIGRWAVKQAVSAWLEQGLSAGPSDIEARAAADGAPELFLRGQAAALGVSIAHAGGRGLAVVGPREVAFGGDLETIEERSPAFLEDYMTGRERDFVYSNPPERRAWAATVVWSAKEAVLKALRTGLREDTRAVEIRLLGGASEGASDPGDGLWQGAVGGCRFAPIRGVEIATGRLFDGGVAVVDGQVITVLGEGGIDLRRLRGV